MEALTATLLLFTVWIWLNNMRKTAEDNTHQLQSKTSTLLKIKKDKGDNDEH
jgi:hypothetical protein